LPDQNREPTREVWQSHLSAEWLVLATQLEVPNGQFLVFRRADAKQCTAKMC